MKTIDVETICEKRGYTKIAIGKIPTWLRTGGKEGIEFGTELKAFNVQNGERYFNQISEFQKETLNKIYEYTKGKVEIPNSPDTIEPQKNFLDDLGSIFDGKRVLTSHDILLLKNMTVYERILLFQKTPKEIQKSTKGRGGQKTYVEGNIMKMEANIAFVYRWSTKIEGWHIDEKCIACWGSMIVQIDGYDISIASVGIDVQEYSKESQKPVFTIAEMMKNALTDMKKKALADLGFNGDVYRGEV